MDEHTPTTPTVEDVEYLTRFRDELAQLMPGVDLDRAYEQADRVLTAPMLRELIDGRQAAEAAVTESLRDHLRARLDDVAEMVPQYATDATGALVRGDYGTAATNCRRALECQMVRDELRAALDVAP